MLMVLMFISSFFKPNSQCHCHGENGLQFTHVSHTMHHFHSISVPQFEKKSHIKSTPRKRVIDD